MSSKKRKFGRADEKGRVKEIVVKLPAPKVILLTRSDNKMGHSPCLRAGSNQSGSTDGGSVAKNDFGAIRNLTGTPIRATVNN